jgi:hypothetical protein
LFYFVKNVLAFFANLFNLENNVPYVWTWIAGQAHNDDAAGAEGSGAAADQSTLFASPTRLSSSQAVKGEVIIGLCRASAPLPGMPDSIRHQGADILNDRT